jgi:hypothetical protein
MTGLPPVVAGLGSGLVVASPVGPAEPVDGVQNGADDERDEQVLDLVAGERYAGVRCGVAGMFVCSDGGEEGVREHGHGDPAGPGRVAADLVLVQCGQALPCWGRVGRAARCQVCWSFSARPPSEPDWPAFQASGSPVTTA